jgi:hypothetical protein
VPRAGARATAEAAFRSVLELHRGAAAYSALWSCARGALRGAAWPARRAGFCATPSPSRRSELVMRALAAPRGSRTRERARATACRL